MARGYKRKTENRSNIVTYSIKALKMVRVKKKKVFRSILQVRKLSLNELKKFIPGHTSTGW